MARIVRLVHKIIGIAGGENEAIKLRAQFRLNMSWFCAGHLSLIMPSWLRMRAVLTPTISNLIARLGLIPARALSTLALRVTCL